MSRLVEQGTDVLFVTDGPERGLYLNGQKVNGVLTVEPDLFQLGGVATVTVQFHASRFRVQSAPDA